MKKVANINEIRSKKSAELTAKGGAALEPYTFDYLLLCNKICGASHYNMQMKIVVEDEATFNKWLKDKKTLAVAVKESKEAPAEAPAEGETAPATVKDTTKAAVDSTKVVAQVIKK
jgi:cytochrome c oxidase subunit 2